MTLKRAPVSQDQDAKQLSNFFEPLGETGGEADSDLASFGSKPAPIHTKKSLQHLAPLDLVTIPTRVRPEQCL